MMILYLFHRFRTQCQADVALQNGGGIRNNTLIPAGDITELTTFDIAPFANFVTIVEDISRGQFKEIMENAVSGAPTAEGRFAQIAGFEMVYDPDGTAQTLDDDGNVVTPGTRVVSLTLDDGTAIVENGIVVAGDPVSVATIDFLARGGDQYPFRDAPFTTVGVSYQQALSNYIVDALGGVISQADYPEGGEGRIGTVTTITSNPTAEPTTEPTVEPTQEPTPAPAIETPTAAPTAEPTEAPTAEPTAEPTEVPTSEPTAEPTEVPTAEPTEQPAPEPTAENSEQVGE